MMRTVQTIIILFATLLLLLLLIVIYDCISTYGKTIIMGWHVSMLDDDDGGLSTSSLNLFSCLYPYIIPSIRTIG